MIEIVDGIGVGSGKSFFVMTRCLAHFLRGGTVYCTDEFELKMSEIIEFCKERYGVILEEDQYRVVPRELATRLHEHSAAGTDDCPVLVIIDEAQDYFDVRDHADKSKREFFSWCTQSRHDNNDVILITQDANNIDARFRRLATHRITVRNSRNWKIPGLGSVASLIQLATLWTNNGWYFAVHYYDRDGRTLFERKWVKAKQELFNLYVSKSRAGAHKRAGLPVEQKKLKKVEVTERPMLKYFVFLGILAGLVMMGVVAYRINNGSYFGVTEKAEPSAPRPAVAAAPSKTESTREPAQAKAAYAIITEPFRLLHIDEAQGAMIMRTAGGLYQPGTMSAHGYVVGIDAKGRVAKAIAPEGHEVYIVGIDDKRVRPDPDEPKTSSSKKRERDDPEKTSPKQNSGPKYLDRGQSVALGFAGPEVLDFAQARILDENGAPFPSRSVK